MTKEDKLIKLSIDKLPKPWKAKQFIFAKAYVGEANCIATKAAKIAGYSDASAYSIGSDFLRKPEFKHIQDYIAQELGVIVERFDASKEGLLQRLEQIAFSNLTDVIEITENGRVRLKPFDKIPKHALAALKSVTDKSGNTDEIGVTLHDPIGAIKEMARITKLYDEMSQTNIGEVHIYIPDNGRDNQKKEESNDE